MILILTFGRTHFPFCYIIAGTCVIGADLWNEPKMKASWGYNPETDWNLAAERVGAAIQNVNPDWLIFVEGIGVDYWWGGNLQGVKTHPVRLPIPNKVVYSVHEYIIDLYPQPWFTFNTSYPGGPFPGNMRNIWDSMWGYIVKNDIAPVWVGEFGTDFKNEPWDTLWLPRLLKYMEGEFTTDGVNDLLPGQTGLSWSWWAINPDLQDYSLFQEDWYSVVDKKMNYLKPYLAPPLP